MTSSTPKYFSRAFATTPLLQSQHSELPFEYHSVGVVVDPRNHNRDIEINSGVFTLYLNGKKVSFNYLDPDFFEILNHLIIGVERINDSSLPHRGSFNGWINEIRVYNRALSNSEIKQLSGKDI